MYSNLDVCLALLLGLWVGASLGVMAGGMNRCAKRSEQQPEQPKQFRVPAAHREYEHECDAPYPRLHD